MRSNVVYRYRDLTACGNRFFAPAARRDSKKIQPEGSRRGQKMMRKSAVELIFSWVLFVRTEIPCLWPKRYAQLRSQSQFCLTKCAPPIPVLCVCKSSPQRSIKATYPPRPQGTKALEKGELACAAVSTSCLVLSSCSPQ